MEVRKLLMDEFDKRVFEESYERIYRCISLIDEKDLWRSPSTGIPAIGNLILHLCGNARQWILSGLGGRPDNRDRDQEFVAQTKIKKGELVFLLENMRSNLRQTLEELDPQQITTIYTIQGFEVTGFSVVVHVIEHFSYHTGQITTLTKLLTNKDTGYYSGIDLNKQNRLN
jgi:uncharacterized damage-inducible protein DinB